MASVVRNKRGSIITQFALLLPILVVLVLMSFEVWQIISVKKSLHMAAYQAARYIASFPHELRQGKNVTTAQKARTLIEENLVANPLLADRLDEIEVYVSPLGWDCGAEFEVAVAIIWETRMPFLDRIWRGTLISSYTDRIICRE